MKATATTKLGGLPKRGPGLKLVSDYKGMGGQKKASKASKKAV
jgi:hypothetical protein